MSFLWEDKAVLKKGRIARKAPQQRYHYQQLGKTIQYGEQGIL